MHPYEQYRNLIKDILVKAGISDDPFAGITEWVNENTYRISGAFMGIEGVNTEQVIADLRGKDNYTLEISSPGGFLSEALKLHSFLEKENPTITTQAIGVVASAAMLPFVFGTERQMASGSQLMIHQPHTMFLAIGTADEIEKAAASATNALRSYHETYAKALEARWEGARDSLAKGVDDWFTSERAIETGLATGMIPTPKADSEASATAFDFTGLRAAAINHKAFMRYSYSA